MKLCNMNRKRHGGLRTLTKIQNQLEEPEWISCDTLLQYLTLGTHE